MTKSILAVDRNRRNLEVLAQVLGKEGYSVTPVTTLKDFVQAVSSSSGEISMALVDVSGFDKSIFDGCALLQERSIPFLVVSHKNGPQLEQSSRDAGASGTMKKPLGVGQLLAVIRSLV